MKYLLLLMTLMSSFAGSQLAVAADQVVWYSTGTSPEVEVSLSGSELIATVWGNIPAVSLQRVNTQLYETYSDLYVRIEDFNKDGVADIGVLSGASLGGGNLCYRVYEYVPLVYSYSNKPAFRWCSP